MRTDVEELLALMDSGEEWTPEEEERLAELIHTVFVSIDRFVEHTVLAVSRVIAAGVTIPATVDPPPVRTLPSEYNGGMPRDQMGPGHDGEGCWADEWYEGPDVYGPCNVHPSPTSELGLCRKHEAMLRHRQEQAAGGEPAPIPDGPRASPFTVEYDNAAFSLPLPLGNAESHAEWSPVDGGVRREPSRSAPRGREA